MFVFWPQLGAACAIGGFCLGLTAAAWHGVWCFFLAQHSNSLTAKLCDAVRQAMLPYLVANHVPFLAPFTGARFLRTPFVPEIVNLVRLPIFCPSLSAFAMPVAWFAAMCSPTSLSPPLCHGSFCC